MVMSWNTMEFDIRKFSLAVLIVVLAITILRLATLYTLHLLGFGIELPNLFVPGMPIKLRIFLFLFGTPVAILVGIASIFWIIRRL